MSNWKDVLSHSFLAFSMALGGAIGGGLATYSFISRPTPNVIVKNVQKTQKVDMKEFKFKKQVKLEVKDDLEGILNGQIPYKTLDFKKADHKVLDNSRKKISVDELVQRSNSEKLAKDYVNNMLLDLKKDVYDKNPKISSVNLAKVAVNRAWKDLSKNSTYTYNMGGKGDTTKTLSDFLSERKKILRQPNGDCKDYTMALLSAYEIMYETSKSKRDSNPFYEKLVKGLMHHQVMGICYSGHCMIGTLTYNYSLLEVEIEPLEPQTYGAGISKDYFFTKVDKKLFLMDNRNSDELKVHHVFRLYDSKGIYIPNK